MAVPAAASDGIELPTRGGLSNDVIELYRATGNQPMAKTDAAWLNDVAGRR
jgi:hypothetical protein